MNYLLLALGIGLIVFIFIDAFWTTLWVDSGAGPLSSRLTTWLWKGYRRSVGKRNDRRLSLFGPFVLMLTLFVWIAVLWCGWVFVFAGGDEALLHSSERTTADWSARFYFVGYMMFTAGNGDYVPNGDGWEVAAALTNATGMILVTLAITYLLSVVSAVVAKRAFASQVLGLGSSPSEFVERGWNGRDFHSLDLPLNDIASKLPVLAQQYEAYPILQYYHAAKRERSPIVAVAVLDEALTILCYGVSEKVRPNAAVLHSIRSAIASLLETMPSAFIKEAPDPPPAPETRRISDKNIPIMASSEFESKVAELSGRRKDLLGLVCNDGWTWEDTER